MMFALIPVPWVQAHFSGKTNAGRGARRD